MGLLSHMEAIRARDLELKVSGSMVNSSQKKRIADYHSFSERTALKRSAVLVPFGKRFFMRYEHGFDVASIFKSISSVDFWNGTIPQNQDWHTVSGSNLEPFYQLFSDEVVQDLTTIHIKSFVVLADVPIKAIMIAVDATIDEELVDDYIPYLADFIASDVSNDESYFSSPIFSSTPSIDNCRTFTLTIKEAIAEIADLLHVDTEAFDILFPVFLSETKNRLQHLLGKGDYALPGNEFNIILLFSQGKSIAADLLQFQLQKNLFSLFGSSTPKILVESVQS